MNVVANDKPGVHEVCDPAGTAEIELNASSAAANHLRRSTARGALVSVGGQAANFVLRTGSMIVLARLITPKDFGLVGMVAAVTGFLSLFKDAGLSMAAVQRAAITESQASTLFWVNLAVGLALSIAAAAIAPGLVRFYGDPHLFWITVAMASGFVLYGAAAQHRAILQRGLRFGTIAIIDVVALASSVALAVLMAIAGMGYWSLVVMAISQPAVTVAGSWIATGWVPGWPQWDADIRSLIMFGGAVTLNGVIVYVAYNTDKILLGRFWGAEALGIYGRAYQLVTVANESLFTTIGTVAFPALSLLQNDAVRLRSYFVKGYGLFLTLVMPVGIWCAVFGEDIIYVLLGPKWHAAAPIFRWLVPTTIAFGLTNPFSWLMLATGRAGRCLKIALAVTPLLIASYAIGVGFGPKGVAIGFSTAMMLSVVPVIAWAKHGTLISGKDVLTVVMRPALSVASGVVVALMLRTQLASVHPFARLLIETSALFGTYLVALLVATNQRTIYLDLLKDTGLWRSRSRAVVSPQY